MLLKYTPEISWKWPGVLSSQEAKANIAVINMMVSFFISYQLSVSDEGRGNTNTASLGLGFLLETEEKSTGANIRLYI